MLGIILIVILLLVLFGALPRWSHSRSWGYAPSGTVGLILPHGTADLSFEGKAAEIRKLDVYSW